MKKYLTSLIIIGLGLISIHTFANGTYRNVVSQFSTDNVNTTENVKVVKPHGDVNKIEFNGDIYEIREMNPNKILEIDRQAVAELLGE